MKKILLLLGLGVGAHLLYKYAESKAVQGAAPTTLPPQPCSACPLGTTEIVGVVPQCPRNCVPVGG